MIDCFERKILRRIYGPVCEQGQWRVRWNEELKTLFGEMSISEVVRYKRLQWAGHVIRMEEDRMPRRILQAKFEGRRTVGRPRIRWEDAVRVDAEKLLRIKNWKTAARDRDSWRRKIGEAKARSGL